MPKYEYACKSCGQHLEVVQSFTDDPLTECPACGGPLRKVFGNIGIAFKGSGFYRTDNRSRRSEPKSDAPKADAGGDGKADAGGDGKADTAAPKESKKDAAPAAETKPKTTEAKTA